MSSSIEVGTVEFLSVKDAATQVSYSRDYVARLAREGKIVATHIGRQWFIDPISLNRFVEASELEREIRKRQLREERRKERAFSEDSQQVSHRQATRARRITVHSTLQSVVVLCCGLLLGVIFHTAHLSVTTGISSDQIIAQVLQPTSLPTSDSDQNTAASLQPAPASVATDPDVVLERGSRQLESRHGILVLPEGTTVEDLRAAAELFSDEVTIEYVSEQAGIVTPQFRDENGRPIPFVNVPVKTAKQPVETAYE